MQLIAYFVARTQHISTVTSLREFLREKLPDHMTPSIFVRLEKLPLLPTGKVDRRALPEAGHTRPDVDTPYAAPRTPMEEEVAKIWAEVLSLERVGIHDNFFDLGGHSLAATQVVSRVISSLQVELSSQSLLKAATVADMVAAILQQKAKEISSNAVATILSEVEALTDEEAQGYLDK
jgi:acyl carrier protein